MKVKLLGLSFLLLNLFFPSKLALFLSLLVDELSDVFFPKYFGLFVNPVGFELSFFIKLDFPL